MKIKKSNTKEDIDILLETIIDLQKQVNELKNQMILNFLKNMLIGIGNN